MHVRRAISNFQLRTEQRQRVAARRQLSRAFLYRLRCHSDSLAQVNEKTRMVAGLCLAFLFTPGTFVPGTLLSRREAPKRAVAREALSTTTDGNYRYEGRDWKQSRQ